jgi:ferritin-like metal-binding protein YciE
MPKNAGGPEELLQTELQDLLDAEKQLVRALPRMAKSATDDELEQALRQHLEVTKTQVERLAEVFDALDMRARSHPCKGMRGIVDEGSEVLESPFEGGMLDSAIAGSARKVEHYEIAGYESARTLAQQLGKKDAVELLTETLREEIEADRLLAQISKRLSKSRPKSREAMEPLPARGRTAAKPSGRGRAKSAGSRGRAKAETRAVGRLERVITDPEEIREWAEDRGAVPSCVRGTGGRGDIGMIRLDFPGYSGEESLEKISWGDWARKFEENDLALIVQDKTARGQKSNFNKLVKRSTVEPRARARTAR